MDAVVAVRTRLADGSEADCLTFGQVGLDDASLTSAVHQFVNTVVKPGEAVSSELCANLQAVAHRPYFFEALAEVTAALAVPAPAPIARRLRLRKLRKGNAIWFLGD